MPSEMVIPFHVGADGQIDTTSDPDAQVRQHVLSLVNTEPGERVMLPSYGVAASQFLFEPSDDEIPIRLGTLVESAFAAWEPGVRLTVVVPERAQFEPNNLERIDVEYSRLDSPDVDAIGGTNIAVISAAGSVKEVIRG